MTTLRVSAIPRMATRWLTRTLNAKEAAPDKHSPPLPGQCIVHPVRPPFMWLDSHRRRLHEEPPWGTRRVAQWVRFWAHGIATRHHYPDSKAVDWWRHIQDPEAGRIRLQKRFNVNAAEYHHNPGFDATYYLDGEHLTGLGEQTIQQASEVLSNDFQHVCDWYDYPTEPIL